MEDLPPLGDACIDRNPVGGTLVRDEVVPAGRPWSAIVRRADLLRIVDLEGDQAVDFLCYSAAAPRERYHAPNTLKACRTLALTAGVTLFSEEARPLFTIVADTLGGHDTIGGCCSAPSNAMLYGARNAPGCRENFAEALAAHGMDSRDIVPNVNFFCNVPVNAGRRLADTVFVDAGSRPGEYVELRAETDALAVLSNCPQVNNPCNAGCPTPIRVAIRRKK